MTSSNPTRSIFQIRATFIDIPSISGKKVLLKALDTDIIWYSCYLSMEDLLFIMDNQMEEFSATILSKGGYHFKLLSIKLYESKTPEIEEEFINSISKRWSTVLKALSE